MKQKTGILLAVICFFLIFTHSDCHAERKKKILVLHSYHQGLEWTDNVTKGIQAVLSPYQQYYEIHYEYLDTKRNVGEDYFKRIAGLLLSKNINYEIVIAADNNALNLIQSGALTFRGNPPIVFCGINNFNKEMIKGIKQITGVVESTDHKATIELMCKFHPERKKLIVILDKTPTGEAIREEFKGIEAFYKGRLEFKFYRDFLLKEIPEQLSHFSDDHLIYILTFNRDRNNNFISYTEGIEMISKSTNVPIYGSWDFYLGKGIVGGRITSGVLQGREAAKLALRILNGEKAENIDAITNCPTQFVFDYNYMKKYGIEMASLPDDSIVLNAPPEPYEKYKGMLFFITVFSILVSATLFWKYKRQKSALKAKQALALALEQKVGERTLELENANKKLKRLSNLDGLTQLYNRRYFDQALANELNRLQRTATPVALLMCDIDYFKLYNDTYGHLSGDDCIRAVADIIHKECRRVSDVPARYGGEEFSVIMPNTTIEQALSIAESIRIGLENKEIHHSKSPIKKTVSVSIGVTSLIPDRDTTPSRLISMADEALYESKKNGRDRVTVKRF